MFILDDIALGPIKALMWIAKEIQKAVDQEAANEVEALTQRLSSLYMQLETGQISEADFEQAERQILDRLDAIEAANAAAGEAGAGEDESSQDETGEDETGEGEELSDGAVDEVDEAVDEVDEAVDEDEREDDAQDEDEADDETDLDGESDDGGSNGIEASAQQPNAANDSKKGGA
ncbi:MAG: gas vesicle protein GvpG [Planctomycetota bacterium]|nr:gas vesicle protein GvpG [Planctomycetota bacterium]